MRLSGAPRVKSAALRDPALRPGTCGDEVLTLVHKDRSGTEGARAAQWSAKSVGKGVDIGNWGDETAARASKSQEYLTTESSESG